MIWNTETIWLLRDLWEPGHSTPEIGRRLGCSKNSIVGKAHRLNLESRPSPIRRDLTTPAAPRPAPRVTLAAFPTRPDTFPKWVQGGVLRDGLSSIDRAEAMSGDPSSATDERPKDWYLAAAMKAEPRTTPYPARKSRPCCWPIGEPRAKDFRFCEDGSEPGLPYCDAHCREGYSTYQRDEAA